MKKDIEYFVNLEAGVVVCRINNCRDIANLRIHKYSNSEPWEPWNYTLPDSFIGVAKCAPEDEFDEEYGKKLALLRAKQSRGAAINAMIYKYIKSLRDDIDNLSKYAIHNIPKEDK